MASIICSNSGDPEHFGMKSGTQNVTLTLRETEASLAVYPQAEATPEFPSGERGEVRLPPMQWAQTQNGIDPFGGRGLASGRRRLSCSKTLERRICDDDVGREDKVGKGNELRRVGQGSSSRYAPLKARSWQVFAARRSR
jgi:hypothetical protein